MTTLTTRGTGGTVYPWVPTPPLGIATSSAYEASAEIGRVCVHLSALETSVLPVAARALPDGTARAVELARLGRDLESVLYVLDRHLTGDMLAAGVSASRLRADVQARAAAQADAERGMLTALAGALDAAALTELGRSYHQAALAAPTRPHPSRPRRGLPGRLAAALLARADRVRDTVDNRPVSARARAAVGRALADIEALATPVDAAPEPASLPAAA